MRMNILQTVVREKCFCVVAFMIRERKSMYSASEDEILCAVPVYILRMFLIAAASTLPFLACVCVKLVVQNACVRRTNLSIEVTTSCFLSSDRYARIPRFIESCLCGMY